MRYVVKDTGEKTPNKGYPIFLVTRIPFILFRLFGAKRKSALIYWTTKEQTRDKWGAWFYGVTDRDGNQLGTPPCIDKVVKKFLKAPSHDPWKEELSLPEARLLTGGG